MLENDRYQTHYHMDMFIHYPCKTAVAECGMGPSCLHFSSRHLAQDNSLSACSSCHSWCDPDAWDEASIYKMWAHRQSWCCNFGTSTLSGALLYQCLCSLLFFLYYLLIKEKKKYQFQNFARHHTEFMRYQHNPWSLLNIGVLLYCSHVTILLSSCEAAISRCNAVSPWYIQVSSQAEKYNKVLKFCFWSVVQYYGHRHIDWAQLFSEDM